MSRIGKTLLGAALILWTTACFEVKQEITVNPDGSGKIVQKVTLDAAASKDLDLSKLAGDLMRSVNGVEVWDNVTVRRLEDGSVVFSGTAYCRDVAYVRFHAPDGIVAPSVAIVRDAKDDGSMRLAFVGGDASGEEREVSSSEVAPARAAGKKSLDALEPLLRGSKIHLVVNLPGKIASSSNVKRANASRVALDIDGAKLEKSLESLIGNESAVREVLRWSDPSVTDALVAAGGAPLNRRLLGSSKDAEVVVRPGNAMFDYEAEVAAAKKVYPSMMGLLGVDTSTIRLVSGPDPAIAGKKLRSIDIVESCFVVSKGIDETRHPGTALEIEAGLFIPAIQIDGGMVTKAVASDGSDLLGDDVNPVIHGATLGSDGRSIAFHVTLGLPSKKASGIRELSGIIRYTAQAGETKKVDAGLPALSEGAKGTAVPVTVVKAAASPTERGVWLTDLFFEGLYPAAISSVEVLDRRARTVDVSVAAVLPQADGVTIQLRSPRALPRDGTLLVTMREGILKFDVPFSIRDVDLLGRGK